ncbi:MAG: PEP-CTERM sorting domain-containing protein [Myxococcota bacterium]
MPSFRPRPLPVRRPRAARALLAIAALGTLPLATAARAVPLLSEIFYDAVGSDDGLSFVEIHAPAGTVLDGFTIEGVNGSGGAIGPVIALSGSVSASGLFVVADVDGSGLTAVAVFDQLANFDFQNGPDSIVLRDASGVVDAVGYGVFAPGDVFAGEGAPAVDPPAGESLARVFANVDTDDNALDFVALATPTPGSAAFAPVPEPGTGLLCAIGLAGLGAAGRRRG